MGDKDYIISDFLGGINEAVDESLLKVNEAKRAQNLNIDKGVLSTCLGSSPFTAPNLPGLKTIITYYQNNVGYILGAASGKLYKLSGGLWVQLGSGYSSDTWDYINYNYNSQDVIILTNGVDNVKIYDGTTLRDLKNRRKTYDTSGNVNGYVDANGVTHANESDVTTLAPKGKYIDLHYERLWIADDNNLYFSTANSYGFDIEDWTAPTSNTEANQHGGMIQAYTNDGTKIIGLKVIFDDILIFKEKSIFKIFGSGPSNYQKIQVFSSNGAIADKSIVGTNKGAFFINKDGIYIYDGTNVNLMSQKIQATFSALNRSVLNSAVAYYWENKYIISVPEGSSNDLTIEFDMNNKNFMFKRGLIVSSFVDYGDKLLFVNNDGNVYQYNSSTSWNGSAISSYWETGLTDKGVPDAVKDLDSIYFTASGSGDIKVTCITDTNSKIKTVMLSNTAKVYNINLTNYGRLIGFKIENVSGSIFTLKGFKGILEYNLD